MSSYTVEYASALSSGSGHKKINVRLESNDGRVKNFSSITSNMYDYDKSQEFEGYEKYEALFKLVESQLENSIYEWIHSDN